MLMALFAKFSNEQSSSVLVATLWAVAVLGVIGIAVWLVQRYRSTMSKSLADSSQILTQFREMREEGDLSAEEYQHIRKQLAAKITRELKQDDQSG